MRLVAAAVAGLLLLSVAPSPAYAKSKPAKKSHAKTKAKSKAKARHAAKVERERPVSTYTRDGRPNIQAESAVIVDLGAGEELYAKHADDVRPIASISKLMAMIVVLERKPDLDGTTEMTPGDRDHSRRGAPSRLPTGMTFTNRDLLHAALMASDNRAVTALGRAVGLDIAAMTEAMNKKARELGFKHTSFGDPTGLDDRNRSTPREVAKMLKVAIHVPLISEITRKAKYVARAVSKPGYTVEYENTDLIARGSKFRVLAGKTGYTDLAGYCLAIAARLDDSTEKARDVAMVFLGAPGKLTRFGDFTRCAQWVCEKKPGAPGTPGSAL